MALEDAFVWGRGGRKLSPEEIAKQREIADALMRTGQDYSPVGHWAQGAARVAQGIMGALDARDLDKTAKDNEAWDSGNLAKLLAGGGAGPTPAASSSTPQTASIPSSGAAAEVAATSPATGDTFQPFMDTIKAGGIDNPYALAAIAATGRAESGWSAGNANRTWSDPSESGKPGTAGGIMSWRGPRYEALAATGDLSPQGQAKFFLQEDPALIDKLKSAKSLEEAQGLMNRAWAFAGYNRPGGESSRRLGYAQGYLSSFQNGNGGGTQVASLDPSAGMSASDAINAAATPSGYVDPAVASQNAQPVPVTAPAATQAPEFDAGRFGPRINLAEMPPTRADIAPQMQTQTAALSGVPTSAVAPLDAPKTVSAPPPVAVAPQEVAQAQTSAPVRSPVAPNGTPIPPVIMEVLSDPRSSPKTRAVAELMLKQNMSRQQAEQELRMKQADPAYQMGLEKTRLEIENMRNPRVTSADKLARERFEWEKQNGIKTTDIKEYEYAKERGYEGSIVDFMRENKKAGATNVNVGGEGDKFYEKLDQKNAETFATLSEGGMGARSRMAQLNQLETLLQQSPAGAEAGLKLWLGDLGIATDGVDGLQATRSLIEKMVPEQRAPGSGPMSDADIVMYRRSLASVQNQPGGNALIIGRAKAIAEYDMQMGAIADAVADREIKPSEGRRRIRELKNPLEGYSKMLRDMGINKVATDAVEEGKKTSTGVKWSIGD